MVAVMYIYRETPKLTLNLYEPIVDLAAHRHSLKIQSIYADGFEEMEVPNGGWDNLLKDIPRRGIKHVVMPNLSKWDDNPDAFTESMKILLKQGVSVVVGQATFINNGLINDPGSLAQAIVLIQSKRYYKEVKGLRVRAGQKATDKNIGNTPYGMKNENGKLFIDEVEMDNVRHIMKAHIAGVSKGGIAEAMGPEFNYDKVYHIIEYWEKRLGEVL